MIVQSSDVNTIAAAIHEPLLSELCRRFLYDQVVDSPIPEEDAPF